MTFRTYEETLAASEDLLTSFRPGGFLFSKPSEIALWNQGVPLSPPESNPADSPEMSGQPWSTYSIPDDTLSADSRADHSTYALPSGPREWCHRATMPSAQENLVADPATWMDPSCLQADFGLSPVLSQESQSSFAFPSSDPDFSFAPSSDGGVPVSSGTWLSMGSVGYSSAPDFTGLPTWQGPSGNAFVPSSSQGVREGALFQAQQTWPHTPVVSPGIVPYGPLQPQVMPYQQRIQPVAPRRPLLPRTGESIVPAPIAHLPHRLLLPSIQGSSGQRNVESSVSRVANLPAGIGPEPRRSSAPGSIQPRPSIGVSNVSTPGSAITMPAMFYTQDIQGIQGTSRPYLPSANPASTVEDFSEFLNFDQDEQLSSTGSLRSEYVFNVNKRNPTDPKFSHSTGVSSMSSIPQATGHGMVQYLSPSTGYPMESMAMSAYGYIPEDTTQAASPVELKMAPAKVEQDVKLAVALAPTLQGDSDEGRYRSDPLYSEGPQDDGLYHCPWEENPNANCPHKPAKLKCNYDKFVDSHLKPFRCKVSACAKQEFSSTACLLRHEREAHGMHGHGDRPHLCYYPGCERAIRGNGFPRRYNLFDHMKRVHDHKDDASPTGSPDTGPSEMVRTMSKKRKASRNTPSELPVQRQRTISYPVQPISYAQPGPGPADWQQQNPARRNQHRQRLISQWANQRDLLARQMQFVQSPDDETSLDRLSQNIEELRRLGEQARDLPK